MHENGQFLLSGSHMAMVNSLFICNICLGTIHDYITDGYTLIRMVSFIAAVVVVQAVVPLLKTTKFLNDICMFPKSKWIF